MDTLILFGEVIAKYLEIAIDEKLTENAQVDKHKAIAVLEAMPNLPPLHHTLPPLHHTGLTKGLKVIIVYLS